MRGPRRRGPALGAIAATALAIGAAPAAAHVDVLPTRIPVQEASELTVRVPTERQVPTVAVRLAVPVGVTVFSVAEPPPGWAVRAVRGPDGRVAGVEWRGGRIGVERYQDFALLATPTAEGRTVWRAEQTYADGLVKPWTAEPAAEGEVSVESGPTDPGPASAVEVVAAGEAAAAAPVAEADDDSRAAVWLGIVAIGIAVLAALGVGLLWSSRPASLPEEPDE